MKIEEKIILADKEKLGIEINIEPCFFKTKKTRKTLKKEVTIGQMLSSKEIEYIFYIILEYEDKKSDSKTEILRNVRYRFKNNKKIEGAYEIFKNNKEFFLERKQEMETFVRNRLSTDSIQQFLVKEMIEGKVYSEKKLHNKFRYKGSGIIYKGFIKYVYYEFLSKHGDTVDKVKAEGSKAAINELITTMKKKMEKSK